jgi:hypothetical protein
MGIFYCQFEVGPACRAGLLGLNIFRMFRILDLFSFLHNSLLTSAPYFESPSLLEIHLARQEPALPKMVISLIMNNGLDFAEKQFFPDTTHPGVGELK